MLRDSKSFVCKIHVKKFDWSHTLSEPNQLGTWSKHLPSCPRMTPSLGQLPPLSSWYPPQVRMSKGQGYFQLMFDRWVDISPPFFISTVRGHWDTFFQSAPRAFHHSHWAIRLLGLKSGSYNAGNCIYMHLRWHVKVGVNMGKHSGTEIQMNISIKRSSLKGILDGSCWLSNKGLTLFIAWSSLLFSMFVTSISVTCALFWLGPSRWMIHGVPSSSSLDLSVVVSFITHSFTSQDLQKCQHIEMATKLQCFFF